VRERSGGCRGKGETGERIWKKSEGNNGKKIRKNRRKREGEGRALNGKEREKGSECPSIRNTTRLSCVNVPQCNADFHNNR
jgi:hypothetical protein